MEMYTLHICGLVRSCPIVHISQKTRLANFSLLGDVELVDKIADSFSDKLKNIKFDYLIGTEVKTVPLVHGVAKRLGHPRFIVCRKSVKPYMVSPIILRPLAYFPKHVKPLVLNGPDAEMLKGKRVVVIDDVISTGVTMRMMNKLLEQVEATVVEYLVVIKQGTHTIEGLEHLEYLAELPIFQTDVQRST